MNCGCRVTLIIPGKAPLSLIKKIYPPIDSFNISKIKGFEKLKWTELDEVTFYEMMSSLENQLENEQSNYIDFESKNTLVINKRRSKN